MTFVQDDSSDDECNDCFMKDDVHQMARTSPNAENSACLPPPLGHGNEHRDHPLSNESLHGTSQTSFSSEGRKALTAADISSLYASIAL